MTPDPMMPGTISFSSFFTSGVNRGRGKRSAMPAFWQAITIHRNCATPATVIAQASTWAGMPTNGSTNSSARIITTFSRIGAAAACMY